MKHNEGHPTDAKTVNDTITTNHTKRDPGQADSEQDITDTPLISR